MPHHPPIRFFVGCATLGLVLPAVAGAQVRGLEFTYGRWWHGAPATVYAAGLVQPLAGPLGYGISFTHLDDFRARPDNRSASGAELALTLGRDGAGLYLVGAAGAAVVHNTSAFDGWWSAGGGWALGFFDALSAGVDVRYRWEDRGFRGFWRLHPDDRAGFQVQARVAIGLPGGTRSAPAGEGRPGGASAGPAEPDPFVIPTADELHTLARMSGASETAARATASVVNTALAVMGTPYVWGGTDDNGFDCSGLIQHAYRDVGIILPRVSRDQLRTGTAVDARLDALRPGDLLGFAVERGQLSHIGLYVGEGRFIHSATGGVKISSLTAADPDSRWWQRRWVSARRIIE